MFFFSMQEINLIFFFFFLFHFQLRSARNYQAALAKHVPMPDRIVLFAEYLKCVLRTAQKSNASITQHI